MLKNTARKEEEELIAAIRNSDQAAFGVLYDRYAPVLMGLTSQLLEDKDLAETALKNTFIKVWQGLRSGDLTKGQYGLFVYLLHAVRSEARRLLFEKTENEMNANQPLDNLVHVKRQTLTNGESAADLQKRGVLQCYFDGYSAKETAMVLNIPLPEINYKIRNDLKTLRGNLTT